MSEPAPKAGAEEPIEEVRRRLDAFRATLDGHLAMIAYYLDKPVEQWPDWLKDGIDLMGRSLAKTGISGREFADGLQAMARAKL